MASLDKNVTLKFYKRKDVQEAMIEHAQNKEIGMCYGQGYGKRPDSLTFPQEIIELAQQGVTSFHGSEELWSNSLAIGSNLSKKEIETLRIGWDLVLDIDCAVMEYSRICADLIVQFLEYCGVKDISIKFSGNKGFHIGVPFEAFPKQVGEKLTKDLFPEAPRKIAFYIKENIKEELAKRILAFENNDFSSVKEKVKLDSADIIHYENTSQGNKVAKLNVDKFLEIDTVLISSRHLYRMPCSLHEKSGLVSLPLDPHKVLEFEKVMAKPENISSLSFKFMDRNIGGESARRLLIQALDFKVKMESDDYSLSADPLSGKNYDELTIESPIKEDFFPPCIKLILAGMEDGKKRGLFCLINFLGKIGWSKPEIKIFIANWNQKNREPLREVYLNGQMNSFNAGEKLPPNCNNEGYYKGLGICKPDSLCAKIKNPVNYTILRWKRHLQDREEEKPKAEKKGKKKEYKKEKAGDEAKADAKVEIDSNLNKVQGQ
ncbi:MAG TPA: DNA primase small subunit domain-containing protein [Candidatus Nanoarchaeia archaeon]|nr:DNA primase small subunit domain-containing protein [Candidatus Nanoarchaeia archaeon]